jgi:hypothetical protein
MRLVIARMESALARIAIAELKINPAGAFQANGSHCR